jgi:hypothetical protein
MIIALLAGDYAVPQMTNVFNMSWNISGMVINIINKGYGLTPSEIADAVNKQLASAQRLYQIEVLQASKLLADKNYYTPPGPIHPTGTLITFGVWADALMEKLQWRIVAPELTCPIGVDPDPVTRKCPSAYQAPPSGTCPSGFKLDTATGMCVQVVVETKPITCETGYELDVASGMCVKKAEIPWALIGVGGAFALFMLMRR